MKKRLLSVILSATIMLTLLFAASIATSAAESNAIPGDFTGDGEINLNDILTLRKYLAGYNYDTKVPAFTLPEGSDTNGDGVIDLRDLSCLREFLSETSIIEQPNAFNKYTVTATGDVSYAWYLWEDGKLGAAVEGANTATLTGATDGETTFVDNYTQEYSRDIEPMEGGHGDLYYRWLCEYVRAYKAGEDCPTLTEE